MEQSTLLRSSSLTIGYPLGSGRNKVVQSNLCLTLPKGKLSCLLGNNGAGKSTLLRTLCGSISPLSGEMFLENQPWPCKNKKQLARTVSLVLTDPTFVGGLTVYELVSLGRYPYTGFFGKLSKKDHFAVQEALEWTRMQTFKDAKVSDLSDGERQKVMISKALAQDAPLMILDEPTAYLDMVSRIEILTLLHELTCLTNKTILVSTHDIEQALREADYLWLLSKKHGLSCGVTDKLVSMGEINRYFDRGDVFFNTEKSLFEKR